MPKMFIAMVRFLTPRFERRLIRALGRVIFAHRIFFKARFLFHGMLRRSECPQKSES